MWCLRHIQSSLVLSDGQGVHWTFTPALSDPVAVWRFDDAPGGSVASDSKGKFAATLSGAATFAGGRTYDSRQALSLNGSSGYATVAATLSSSVSNGVTVEAWVYANSVSSASHRGIFSEQSDGPAVASTRYMELSLDGTPARLYLGYNRPNWGFDAIADTANFPVATWVHVAASFDGSKMRLYRNGTKAAESGALYQLLSPGTTPWYIGKGFTQLWNGKIDDMAVWGRVLSDAEILAHSQIQNDNYGDACDPCLGNPDPACRPTTCVDADHDGYGVKGASNCSAGHPELFDCDDGDAAVHPGVSEVAGDLKDNNCDGVIDGQMSAEGVNLWDGNGNLARQAGSGGTTVYTWDARDRLVAVSGPGGSATYGYDTNNLRVKMGDQQVLPGHRGIRG